MKHLYCDEWPPEENKQCIINKNLSNSVSKSLDCYDWPPEYIVEKIEFRIKIIENTSCCFWHNEEEIYCKKDLNWGMSMGHCF